MATAGARAGIVVTGTEVLTGRVQDTNGPWLAERLRELGVDVGEIIVVGDRPEDVRSALRYLKPRVALVITSGGLGPTADDLTAAVVAEEQGRTMHVDAALEQRIATTIERLSRHRGWRLHPEATAAATRKQAHVPDGASVLEPVGTAPGLVVPDAAGGPPVLVLPGPPRELQGMWPAAVSDPVVRSALGELEELRQRTLRLWGTPESELAAVLRQSSWDGLEITTCLRDGGELEIVTRFRPDRDGEYERLARAVGDAFPDTLFSADGRTIDELVAAALEGRTIALAESCTGGLLAARLIDRPGSSEYVLAGLVTYSNEAKQALLGVPAQLIERVGAVSAEVAEAMARGARQRVGTDLGVGITGVAGPGGGTPDKPVGLVHLCVADGERAVGRRIVVPGSRRDVRERSVSVAMHMIRELLTGASD